MNLAPTTAEKDRADEVVAAVIAAIQGDQRIKLPSYSGSSEESADFALQTVGIEPNAFGGTLGRLRYQFEGEDDLLHLFVVGIDRLPVSVKEARAVAAFLLPTLPPALIWLKPGTYSQHFYFGHDELVRTPPRPE